MQKIDSALPRVDVPASPNPASASVLVALPRQDTRQVILVHEIMLTATPPLLLFVGPHVLLLILGEDKLRAPAALPAAAFPFAACVACNGLGDAVAVAAVVPLHVLLQVHCELAVGGRSARDTGERVFAASGAELLVHVLGGEETGVATLDEGFEVLDSLKGGGG